MTAEGSCGLAVTYIYVSARVVSVCFLFARDRCWKTATTWLTHKQVISHRTHVLKDSASDKEPRKPAKLHLECRALISHIAPYFEISAQTLFMSSSACLHCWFFFFCHSVHIGNTQQINKNRKYHLSKKNNNVQSHKHTYDNYIIKVLHPD